ncbi:MAG: hypothetical protein WDM78_06490 [Puia sp.]
MGTLLELLNPAVVAQGRLRKITSDTFDQPSWELSMARKDARLMMEQAASTHNTLMVIPAVAKKNGRLAGQRPWKKMTGQLFLRTRINNFYGAESTGAADDDW